MVNKYNDIFLTKEQKKSIILLSTGTILEYFDLMLYIHMGVFINNLFFPKTSACKQSVLNSLVFCSTFVFRPFGSLFLGYIGDKIGRKSVLVITSIIMSISCIVIATLPTYDSWGIKSSIIMISCRIIQSISSMGEFVGAGLYLTEITKPPVQYVAVGFIDICSLLGGMLALIWGIVCTTYFLNWRYAFFLGSCIAIIACVIKIKLKETSDFIKAKKIQKLANNRSVKNNIKTCLAFFFICSGWPPIFYLCFIYCSELFKNTFYFTPQQIIENNFYVYIFALMFLMFLIYLSQKFNPIEIIKTLTILFLLIFPFCVYFLANPTSYMYIFIIQILLCATGLSTTPATPIFYKNFPILKRFTYSSFLFALSRACMYVIVSFGVTFLVHIYGVYSIFFIYIVIALAFYWGVCYFEKFENNSA